MGTQNENLRDSLPQINVVISQNITVYMDLLVCLYGFMIYHDNENALYCYCRHFKMLKIFKYVCINWLKCTTVCKKWDECKCTFIL